MLKLEDVSLQVANKSILKHGSFEILPGEIACLHGKNGSGKTTLLRTIIKYFPLIHGQIFIDGQSIKKVNQEWIGQHLTYLPQSLTPPLDTLARQFITEVVDSNIYDQFKISEVIDKRFFSLSGGERQRLLLYSTLSGSQPLILLDEPLQSLDREYRDVLGAILRSFAEKGRAVFIANHDSHWTRCYANRKVKLADETIAGIEL